MFPIEQERAVKRTWRNLQFLFYEFLFVDKSGYQPSEHVQKVAIIPGRFSQIWLLTKHEIQIFNHPFIFWLQTGKTKYRNLAICRYFFPHFRPLKTLQNHFIFYFLEFEFRQ
jgi:hypothetical protein